MENTKDESSSQSKLLFINMTPREYVEYVARGIIFKSPFHDTLVQLANISKNDDDDDTHIFLTVEKCPSSDNE